MFELVYNKNRGIGLAANEIGTFFLIDFLLFASFSVDSATRLTLAGLVTHYLSSPLPEGPRDFYFNSTRSPNSIMEYSTRSRGQAFACLFMIKMNGLTWKIMGWMCLRGLVTLFAYSVIR